MSTDLTAFGYIGDISDLIIDIFTGCFFSEQDNRKEILVKRGIEWNAFLNGDLPRISDAQHHHLYPTIDQYLSKEYAKYIIAWLETDKPSLLGDFTKAKNIIDEYFKKPYFLEELQFYKNAERLPVLGRQAFIYQVALSWLGQQKGNRPYGKIARQIKEYADVLNKAKAIASHRHSHDDFELGP